jgi:transcriptional regulator with XRE-family HTH domain
MRRGSDARAVKLIEFDNAQLSRDLRAWLKERRLGSRHKLALHTGVSKNALARIRRGERVHDLSTLLSLISAMGFPLTRYLIRNPRMPARGVDWELFKECVTMFAVSAQDLARRASIDVVTATSVLADGICRPGTYLSICAAMNVDPKKFGLEWRAEWELNKEGRSAVDRYEGAGSHVDHVRDSHLSFADGV